MLALREYLAKQGFGQVLLGLSGGIDSALTAAMAVDALGADKVLGVLLPSPYSSQGSITDALQLAENLGIETQTIPIQSAMTAFDAMLEPSFRGYKADMSEENIQARIRGATLMALSNKYGSLLLTTGNKSENAVGYATLYGDMCGALNLIGDLYKTQVYRLANWRNQTLPDRALSKAQSPIPQASIDKAPSAELRFDQCDQDSLPEYDLLDAVLEALIEGGQTCSEIAQQQGHDPAVIARIYQLLHRAEYKRQQAAPIVKLSERLLSVERSYPISNLFRG